MIILNYILFIYYEKIDYLYDFFKRKVSNDLKINTSDGILSIINIEENSNVLIKENLDIPIKENPDESIDENLDV